MFVLSKHLRSNVIIFCILLHLANAEKKYLIKFTSYRHEIQGDLVNFINFTLANETFRGCFQVAKQMDKFDFGILAKAKTSKNGKSWEVLNVRVPGCDLLGSKRQKPIFVVEQILALLKKYNPRMPRRCPLKKNFYYCYDNVNLKNIRYDRNLPTLQLSALMTFWYADYAIYKGYFEVDVAKG